MARRDDAATLAMKLLFWLVKENLALRKWNSLTEFVEFVGAEEISRLRLARNATYSSVTTRNDMPAALYSVVHERTKR